MYVCMCPTLRDFIFGYSYMKGNVLYIQYVLDVFMYVSRPFMILSLDFTLNKLMNAGSECRQ